MLGRRRLAAAPRSVFLWFLRSLKKSNLAANLHYFASPGVDDLTAADHIGSAYPFGRKAERLRTFFFNVCNGDDGRTWSTPFVVDDPSVYVVR